MSFKVCSLTPCSWLGRPLLIAVVSVLLVSCDQVAKKPAPTATLEDKVTLSQVAFSDLPGWQDDKVVGAFPALSKSCQRYERWPDDKAVGPDALAGRASDWKTICASLANFMAHPENHKDFGIWLEENLVPFQVKNNDDQEGLFTGYYEAELKGSFRSEEHTSELQSQ